MIHLLMLKDGYQLDLRLLDYICSNRRNGGLPEGRIIEIFGPPSIGKSHIATQIARTTQQMGGISSLHRY